MTTKLNKNSFEREREKEEFGGKPTNLLSGCASREREKIERTVIIRPPSGMVEQEKGSYSVTQNTRKRSSPIEKSFKIVKEWKI